MVWWLGKAWIYEQASATTFTRQEIPTDNPVTGGYFVPGSTLAPRTKVATAYEYTVEVRRAVERREIDGVQRHDVYTHLEGNFPGGTVDLTNRFQLRNRSHAVAYALREGLI